jgi:Kef-type K+ transport system membrane component KefB
MALSEQERFWIKSKAIAAELVALAVMFVALQSNTAGQLAQSVVVLVGLVLLLPWAFRYVAEVIVPYAPKSEFTFLLMIGVLAAMVTRQLGVYYLVGAFVVGVIAQRFRERLPRFSSEQMLHAVEVFASFFIPFYFFYAGLHLQRDDFGLGAVAVGAVFLAAGIPLRLLLIAGHRWLVLREPLRGSLRIGLCTLPTLVFTLVIAEILRDRFGVPNAVFGGLIIYTLANTLLPGFAIGPAGPGQSAMAPAADLSAGVVTDVVGSNVASPGR